MVDTSGKVVCLNLIPPVAHLAEHSYCLLLVGPDLVIIALCHGCSSEEKARKALRPGFVVQMASTKSLSVRWVWMVKERALDAMGERKWFCQLARG